MGSTPQLADYGRQETLTHDNSSHMQAPTIAILLTRSLANTYSINTKSTLLLTLGCLNVLRPSKMYALQWITYYEDAAFGRAALSGASSAKPTASSVMCQAVTEPCCAA